MSYGISGIAHGLSQGLQQYKEDERVAQMDQQDQERHDATMQAHKQDYGIRQTKFEDYKDQQGQAEEAQRLKALTDQALRGYHAGQTEALTPLVREIYDLPEEAPIEWDIGENQVRMNIAGNPVEMERQKFEAYLQDFAEPGKLQSFVESQRQAIAQATQAENEHERDIQGRLASRVPGERVTMGEDGQLSVLDPDEVPGGSRSDLSADERKALAISKAMNIPESQAWQMVLEAGRKPAEQWIQETARSIMQSQSGVMSDMTPEAAFEQAATLYEEITREYGVGAGGRTGAPQPDPQASPDQGGGQEQVNMDAPMSFTTPGGKTVNATLRQITEAATEAVADGEDPYENAQEMSRLGVPDSVVAQWYEQHGK